MKGRMIFFPIVLLLILQVLFPGTSTSAEQSSESKVDLQQGLLGEWNYEDASGNTIPDQTGNGNDGELKGNATVTSSDMGESLALDGSKDSFMYTPLNVNTAKENVTMSMWFKLDDAVFDEQPPEKDIILLQQEGSGRSLLYITPDKHIGTFIGGQTVKSKETINVDGWQHIAMTVNSKEKEATMYIDGIRDRTFSISGLSDESNAGFRIGVHKDNVNVAFHGLIDETRIYDRVLSDQEIEKLFTKDSPEELVQEKFHHALNEAENVYERAESMKAYQNNADFPDQQMKKLEAQLDEAQRIDPDNEDNQTLMAMSVQLVDKAKQLDKALKQLNVAFVDIDENDVMNEVDQDLYGANHRYGENGYGMWDEKNKRIDPDFKELYNQVDFGSIRYPGGWIANLFDWKRSIGPVEDRKLTIHGDYKNNLAQDPTFGLDEAARFAEETNSTLNYVYNIGNGSAEDAANLVKYLNGEVGTSYWADLRAENGHPEPYDMFHIEIGNENNQLNKTYWMSGEGKGNHVYKYANGGKVSFDKQDVVMDEEWATDEAATSDGKENQIKYIRYAPLKEDTVDVFVDDDKWEKVDSLKEQGKKNVYTIDHETGKITFGDGTNGDIPKEGARIQASYTTIQDGFKDYAKAIKDVDPRVKVYSSISNDQFLEDMNQKDIQYDGVVSHLYGGAGGENMKQYHDQLMEASENKLNEVKNLQEKVKDMNPDMDVPVTEYGIANWVSPYRNYLNSTGSGLYVAKTLMGYSRMDIPSANKHSLIDKIGQKDSLGAGEAAMIQNYVNEDGKTRAIVNSPAALTLEMFNKDFGRDMLKTNVSNNPSMNGDTSVNKLDTIASKDDKGNVYIMVANTDRLDDVKAEFSLDDMGIADSAEVTTMKSPAFNSQNTPENPDNVKLVDSEIKDIAGKEGFSYTIPKHSFVKIKLTPLSVGKMKSLINNYEEAGDISSEAARTLKLHVTTIDHYEKKGNDDKALKHLQSFKKLVKNQKEDEKISKEVSKTLKQDADYLIMEWDNR